MRRFICSIFMLVSIHSYAAGSDFLASKTIFIPGPNGKTALRPIENDLKSLFLNYQPVPDSGSQITRPLQVEGSNNRPILLMEVKKCVLFVCETVEFDGVVSIQDSTGPCQQNYLIETDLSQSNDTLRDVYDRIDMSVCYNVDTKGRGTMRISAQADRAPTYQAGITQTKILSFLRAQVEPITKAFYITLGI